MQDFEIGVIFVRPDGLKEVKDPNWLEDAGFKCLAPSVFGSDSAWSQMTDIDRVECSESDLRHFCHHNRDSWERWYKGYCETAQRRV